MSLSKKEEDRSKNGFFINDYDESDDANMNLIQAAKNFASSMNEVKRIAEAQKHHNTAVSSVSVAHSHYTP
ncbi:hypothetical protein [Mucilaginibacter polytrichastri]|uniref:Uncharacterized protein n=1 Tax=Mucilaginibacter polytrichastri TaxID=1302689 RepID=A0A1Q6A2E9_9SPHI|nr:hypothetical protein [Mucilaginibacter polytrichastri]OKS88186.1 hypothetical protein RG47T_3650 [Mucilaginibacter polytrichastri]SFT08717.1 hypothetical protein SAMN04487890_11053 [Mucilaginibacter polytrichastri]